jgi:hypothetical protein
MRRCVIAPDFASGNCIRLICQSESDALLSKIAQAVFRCEFDAARVRQCQRTALQLCFVLDNLLLPRLCTALVDYETLSPFKGLHP